MVEYYGKWGECNFRQAFLVGVGAYQSSVRNHSPTSQKVRSKIITITRKFWKKTNPLWKKYIYTNNILSLSYELKIKQKKCVNRRIVYIVEKLKLFLFD